MAYRTGLSVDGLGRLRRDLRRVGEDTADLKEANASAAALVARVAAGRAPRRSGRLAGTVRGNRAVSRATVSAGRASVSYAGPVHWGWPQRKPPAKGGPIEANPFVVEAAQDSESLWVPLYEGELEKLAHRLDGNRY